MVVVSACSSTSFREIAPFLQPRSFFFGWLGQNGPPHPNPNPTPPGRSGIMVIMRNATIPDGTVI